MAATMSRSAKAKHYIVGMINIGMDSELSIFPAKFVVEDIHPMKILLQKVLLVINEYKSYTVIII
jgi:hypothetical protein